MSGPVNNLAEFSRKPASSSAAGTSSARPATPSNNPRKLSKFKPAKSIATQDASPAVRKPTSSLPTFSTPTVGKNNQTPLRASSVADNALGYVNISSTESSPIASSVSSVPSKRPSYDPLPSVPPYGSPQKRLRVENGLDKENVFVPNLKGKAKAADCPLPPATPSQSSGSSTAASRLASIQAALSAVTPRSDLDEMTDVELYGARDTANDMMDYCNQNIGRKTTQSGRPVDKMILNLIHDAMEQYQSEIKGVLKARQRGELSIPIPITQPSPVYDTVTSAAGGVTTSAPVNVSPVPNIATAASAPSCDMDIEDYWETAGFPEDFEDPLPVAPPTPVTPPATQRPLPVEKPVVQKPMAADVVLLNTPPLGSKTVSSPEIHRKLKDVFGLSGFRPCQREAIEAILEGKDVFVLMPTGGGKSLCYQLPSVCDSGKTKGLTVVVSPLVALMIDQVQALRERGVDADCMYSEKGLQQNKVVMDRLWTRDRPRILYITPESLQLSGRMKSTLDQCYNQHQLARFVIDEAHCITDWGRRFRASYGHLTELRKQWPQVPIMALTATANPDVQRDIIDRLGIANCSQFKLSFNRTNLDYEVRSKKKGMDEEIVNWVKAHYPKDSGIIYHSSRAGCEELAKRLRETHNLSARHYHAGMGGEDKRRLQDDWRDGRCLIIVATVAFGMGIDKADVRFVIHYSIPGTLANYYQETGRAGRDGKPATCIMYYAFQDACNKLARIRTDDAIAPQDKPWQEEDVNHIINYCQNNVTCRRQQVLGYFREVFDARDCRMLCDNCRNTAPISREDCTDAAISVVKLFRSLTENRRPRVTQRRLALIIRGSASKDVMSNGYHLEPLFGCGKHLKQAVADSLVIEMLTRQIFHAVSVANGDYSQTYLELDETKANALLGGHSKVELSYRDPRGSTSKTPARQKKSKDLDELEAGSSKAAAPSSTARTRKSRAKVSPVQEELPTLPMYIDDDDDDVEFVENPRPSAQWPPKRGGRSAPVSAFQPAPPVEESDIEEIEDSEPETSAPLRVRMIEPEDVIEDWDDVPEAEDKVLKCYEELIALRSKIINETDYTVLKDLFHDGAIGMLAGTPPADKETFRSIVEAEGVVIAHLKDHVDSFLAVCARYSTS